MGAFKRIGELLAEGGIISNDIIDKVVAEQRVAHMRFGDMLICKGLASEDDIAKTLSIQHGLEYTDVNNLTIMPDVLLLVPEDMAKRHSVLPLYTKDKALFIITPDPLNIDSIKEIEFCCGMKIQTLVGTRTAITDAINYHYRFDASVSEFKGSAAPAGYITEPEKARLNSGIHGPLTSRLKILARLNIAERRLPQDGGFRFRVRERDIDVRLSTLPVSGGEKTVIRILDNSQTTVSLEHLGLSQQDYCTVQALIQRKKGIILVTGPTGSGKTTTLYSIINRIKSGMLNIVTVEDPVEYNIPGINQVHARPDIGLTFARCLRSILRQDPDVRLISGTWQ